MQSRIFCKVEEKIPLNPPLEKGDFLRHHFHYLSSVFCSLTSVFCFPSSVFCLLSSDLCLLFSVICHLSSVFCPLPAAAKPSGEDGSPVKRIDRSLISPNSSPDYRHAIRHSRCERSEPRRKTAGRNPPVSRPRFQPGDKN